MRIAKVGLASGHQRVGVLEGTTVRLLHQGRSLADVLHAANPVATAQSLLSSEVLDAAQVRFLAPIDAQEVWAAGVTYKRSQVARMEESEHGATHYDRVYSAARPEIFFKATPHRVAGPGEPVRIRKDTQWSVPEPEFTLVISPAGKIVGYTIGNDMSARDIEGENPLYLPQAKLYSDCCGLGPCVLLAEGPLDLASTKISLTISRAKATVFQGETHLSQLNRTFEDLADWLYRDNSFPTGAFLLTGTGIVPPNEFTLAAGDLVSIEVSNIGTLVNPVVQG